MICGMVLLLPVMVASQPCECPVGGLRHLCVLMVSKGRPLVGGLRCKGDAVLLRFLSLWDPYGVLVLIFYDGVEPERYFVLCHPIWLSMCPCSSGHSGYLMLARSLMWLCQSMGSR